MTKLSGELISFGRELAALAQKYGLRQISGTIVPSLDDKWKEQVTFFWTQGRHGADAEKISLNSHIAITVRVDQEGRTE